MKQTYIGVTGIKSVVEAAVLSRKYCEVHSLTYLRNIAQKWDYATRKLMLGILCSSKRIENPYEPGTQSPSFNKIPEILQTILELNLMEPNYRNVSLLPAIHYYPAKPELLKYELETVLEKDNLFSRGLCSAIQLNTAWPSPRTLEDLKQKYVGLEFIIQLPKQVLDNKSTEEVVDRASEYTALADYLIIDASGGRGMEFDLNAHSNLAIAIKEKLPDISMVFAGGLDNENVYLKVIGLRKSVPFDFSIDAQAKLRTDDKLNLDLKKTSRYLSESMLAYGAWPI